MKTIFTLVVSGQMTEQEKKTVAHMVERTIGQKFQETPPIVRVQEFDIKDDAPIFLKDLNCAFCKVGGVAALEVNEFTRCPSCGAM